MTLNTIKEQHTGKMLAIIDGSGEDCSISLYSIVDIKTDDWNELPWPEEWADQKVSVSQLKKAGFLVVKA